MTTQSRPSPYPIPITVLLTEGGSQCRGTGADVRASQASGAPVLVRIVRGGYGHLLTGETEALGPAVCGGSHECEPGSGRRL